jgi:hypothetical protein
MSYSSKIISILGPVILEDLFKVSRLSLALGSLPPSEYRNRNKQKNSKEKKGIHGMYE